MDNASLVPPRIETGRKRGLIRQLDASSSRKEWFDLLWLKVVTDHLTRNTKAET